MAMSPDQLSAYHRSQGPAQPIPEQAELGLTFYRNEFVNIQGPESRLDRKLRPEGQQEEELAVISESLRSQYGSFLRNYVKQLSEMQRRDPTLLEGGEHVHDRLLLTQLVDERGEPNVDKINEFLGKEKPRNWEVATLAMEHQAARLLFALGVDAQLNPQGLRVTQVDNKTIRTMIDEGTAHKIWNDTAWPWLNEQLNRTGGRINPNALLANRTRLQVLAPMAIGDFLGMVGGTVLSGSPIPAAMGAGTVPAGVAAIIRSFREGVTIDVQRLADTFESLGPRPPGAAGAGVPVSQELRFMSAMTGINLDNYEIVGGAIQLRLLTNHEITKSPQQTLEEALKLLYTRQELMTTLGIPYERLDEMPEQFIFNPPPGGFDNELLLEQTAFRGHADVYEEFLRPSVPGVLGGLGLTPADSLMRWREARARVLGRKIQEEIDRALREKERGGVIAQLDQTINNFDQVKTKRVQEITNRKTALESDQALLVTQRNSLKQYRNGVAIFREELERTGIEAQIGLTEALASLRNPAAAAPFPDAPTALTALNAVLDTAGTSIIVRGRTIRSTIERSENAETALNAPLVGTSPAQQALERQGREAAFNREMERINQDIATINDAISRLETAMRPLRTTVPETLLQTNENVQAVMQVFQNMQTEFTTITGWPVPVGISLTEADLRDPTIGVAELLQRINTANAANPAVGWPEANNNIPEVRARLISAMTEARARDISPAIAAPGAEFTALTATGPPTGAAPGWELTEHQLFIMTGEQIEQLLTVRQTTNPARYGALVIPPLANIEVARFIAQTRLTARNQAFTEMEDYLKVEIASATRLAESVDLTESRERYQMAKTLLENQGKLYENAATMAEQAARFFNTTAVDPADTLTFTEAERDQYTFTPPFGAPIVTQYSMGYLEFMHLLFDYRKAEPDARNRAFRIARAVLPPDRLAILLDGTVGRFTIPPIAAPRNDLDQVFADAQVVLNNGRMKGAEIQEALERIVNRVALETQVRGI